MGTQLTQLPVLNPSGLDLQQYSTYVRKTSEGGVQDFQFPVASLVRVLYAVPNKEAMRTLNPTSALEICHAAGGVVEFDNQGGIYLSMPSQDQDNDGDRIRPNDFKDFVWWKFM